MNRDLQFISSLKIQVGSPEVSERFMVSNPPRQSSMIIISSQDVDGSPKVIAKLNVNPQFNEMRPLTTDKQSNCSSQGHFYTRAQSSQQNS